MSVMTRVINQKKVNLKEVIAPAFYPFHKAFKDKLTGGVTTAEGCITTNA